MRARRVKPLAAAALAALLGACGGPELPAGFDAESYTHLTLSLGDTLDPAWTGDTSSKSLILNLYDTLFFFDGSSTDRLLPGIAETVPTKENGLISADGKTYTIPIRKGVKFHDGTPLTAEDARYSLLRYMLKDRKGGPSQLLLQPLLGVPSTRDEHGALDPRAYEKAAAAVRLDGDRLVLSVRAPFPPLLQLLCVNAPIVSRDWAAKNGDWDGSAGSWSKFNNPKKDASPFDRAANGSGPFKLERLDPEGKELVLARNDEYWRGPAKLKRVVIRVVEEFGTRKLLLQAGEADSILADLPQRAQVEGIPGVSVIGELSGFSMNPVVYFTFKVDPASPFIGSGTLGDGIPPDFFSDKDIRKAFAYAMDYEGFIRDVFPGAPARGIVPAGLLGHGRSRGAYALDLGKSRAHFKRALGGKAWRDGFKLVLAYNAGNVPREIVCRTLKRNIESLNPKFKLELRALKFPELLADSTAGKLPLFVSGQAAEYPDPHDLAFSMMHSRGSFGARQRYRSAEADRLVEAALREGDPGKRAALYGELQALAFEEAPHLLIVDALRFRTQRGWVRGWRHNPMYPASPYASYYYGMWKDPGR